MSLTVSGQTMADVQIINISLRPIVGAYELLFMLSGISIVMPNRAQANQYWMAVHSAEVTVTPTNGNKLTLGTARPNQPLRIQLGEHQMRIQAELKLMLYPHQLSSIEEQRNNGDLHFEMAVNGEGGFGSNRYTTHDAFSKPLPRSDWIAYLRSARVLDIMLIEVPMPITDVPSNVLKMAEHLKLAQKLFVEGNYSQSVAECRHVIELVRGGSLDQPPWTDLLKMLTTKEQREVMTKEQRESVIYAAVRHYTHNAHHPGAVSGTDQFSRSEAKLALTLCTCLVAYQINVGAP